MRDPAKAKPPTKDDSEETAKADSAGKDGKEAAAAKSAEANKDRLQWASVLSMAGSKLKPFERGGFNWCVLHGPRSPTAMQVGTFRASARAHGLRVHCGPKAAPPPTPAGGSDSAEQGQRPGGGCRSAAATCRVPSGAAAGTADATNTTARNSSGATAAYARAATRSQPDGHPLWNKAEMTRRAGRNNKIRQQNRPPEPQEGEGRPQRPPAEPEEGQPEGGEAPEGQEPTPQEGEAEE